MQIRVECANERNEALRKSKGAQRGEQHGLDFDAVVRLVGTSDQILDSTYMYMYM